MSLPRLLTLCSLLLAAPCAFAAQEGELLLYAPQPSTVEAAPAPDQGVLVKTVIVKRGDTLRKLSRQHLGRAAWFPQVLVFNSIGNPDLIHPGAKLRVPVPTGKAVAKPARVPAKKEKAARRTPRRAPVAAAPATAVTPWQPGEEELYQQARQAYLSRDYQQALDRFSSFLRRFPQSRFAADAALYRANCYLRMSGE